MAAPDTSTETAARTTLSCCSCAPADQRPVRSVCAAAALLMVFASVAALASETVRNGLAQLRLQFFPDNVTIEAAPEPATEQAANGQTGPTVTKEFHAYKWKEVPEGYEVTFEEENSEFGYYIIDYEDAEDNFINYMQNDESYMTSITYDEEKGYKREIQLKDGSEALSISDGRRNTIFYKKIDICSVLCQTNQKK